MNAAVTPAELGRLVEGACNSQAVAPASAQAKRDAEMAGAQAFMAGVHSCPHDFERDASIYRAWCRGYKEARQRDYSMYGEVV